MTERLAKLEQRLDSVLPTLSTKAEYEGTRTDVHKGQSEMKSWTIATSFVLLMDMFTIAAYFSNHVSAILAEARHTPSSAPIAPIIIQVPIPHADAAEPAPSNVDADTKQLSAN